MDESNRLLCFNFNELNSLRTAMNYYLVSSAIFDLNTANDSILDAIGYVQKSDTNCRIICITGRKVVGNTVNHNNGAISYVHSPIRVAKLRKQLLRTPSAEALPFQGPCHGRSLLEVIQLLLFVGLSGRLSVWSAFMRGEVWVHRTQLVHAELGGLQGQPALQALCELTRGTFRYQKGRSPQQTLQLGLYHPLLIASVPDSDKLQDPADSGDAFDEPEDEELAAREPSSMSSGDSACSATDEAVSAEALSWLPVDDSEPRAWPAQAGAAGSGGHQWPRPLPSILSPSASSTGGPSDAHAASLSGPSMAHEPSSGAAPDCVEQFPEPSNEALWQQLCASETYNEKNQENIMAVTASSVKEVLSRLELTVEGFIGAAVADSDSGMCLGSIGGAGILNVEVAAAGNTEVVRAKRKAMKTLNIRDDIEDMLITLGKHYHLIRPLRSRPVVFIYIAVDRTRANLAMTRYALADAERDLGA